MVAGAGYDHILVVFVKPCIHCPAEQTTVELMAIAAARATESEANTTIKVESIRQMDRSEERKPAPALHWEREKSE